MKKLKNLLMKNPQKTNLLMKNQINLLLNLKTKKKENNKINLRSDHLYIFRMLPITNCRPPVSKNFISNYKNYLILNGNKVAHNSKKKKLMIFITKCSKKNKHKTFTNKINHN